MVEHATDGYALDVCLLDAESDDATGEHIHHQQHPVTAKQDRFTAKQIHAKEAVLGLREECQPGGAARRGMVGVVVLREHTAHGILVDLDAERRGDLLGDA